MQRRLSLLTAISVLALFSVQGCTTEKQTLTFSPNNGDSRNYQVFTDTSIVIDTGLGRRSEHIRSVMLSEYTAEQQDGWLLHIKPTYLHLDTGQHTFSSVQPVRYQGRDISDIMSQGFELHFDNNMQMTEFVIKAAPGVPTTEEHELFDLFTDTLTRPGFAHGIQLYEGASRMVPADGDLPQVNITLTEIREDNALFTLQGESESVRVFGLAVVNIDFGWVERATMVTDIMEVQDDHESSVRSVMSLFPSDWIFGMDLEFLNEVETTVLNQISDFDVLPTSASKEDVLTHATGYIENSIDHLSLVYPHQGFEVNALGRMRLRDVHAFDNNNELLDLVLQVRDSITFTNTYGAEHTLTKTGVMPLGWENAYQQLTKLGYMQATMDWYPTTHEVVALSVADTQTHIEVDDATARLTPTQNNGVYMLEVEQGEQVHFDYQVAGASTVSMNYKVYAEAPKWVNIGESRLLTLTEYGYYPGYYEITFDGERPETIQLLAVRTADIPAASREVRFYTAD